jgi:archaeal flagellar protein FlaI
VSFLPFVPREKQHECTGQCGAKASRCLMNKKMSEKLQEQCLTHPFLMRYICGLPLEDVGIPEYYVKLNRSMRGLKNLNLLYAADKEIFIHVLANPEDIRDYYIPVEPNCFMDLDDQLDKVERYLADYVEIFEGISEGPKRLAAILAFTDKLVDVKGKSKKGNNGSDPKALPGNLKLKTEIAMTADQYDGLCYLIRRKVQGMGVLDPLIRDNNLEDISCSGLGPIFVEHRVFGGLRTSIGFETHDTLDKFVIELAEGVKHPVTFRNPCVDATLDDGSRINIVYGIDVSKRGSNFTIRKFTPVPLSVIELIQSGALNYEMAAYLSIIIQEQMNVFVSGETASGKTTLMNAIAAFMPPESKIVSIEDTPEVQVPHPNWIRGVTRGSAKTSEASEVNMFDLLKAALRQRPNFIIIGEIRGIEGNIAFQAMQTGHACMSTFHAASVPKLIQRLTGNPINVPKSYVDNLNVVVITQMVRLPNGQSGRRVTSICEIVGYDSLTEAFSFIEAFSWQPADDSFLFRGNNNSYLLEEKIAPKRGIPREKKQRIYSIVKQRAEVLKRLQDQKITNFYDVYRILSKAYREGYFR